MPLPLILGAAAAIGAAAGVGGAVSGGVKMKKASDSMKSAEERHKKNVTRFEVQNQETARMMDVLGKMELEILASFSKFSDIIERIQNRPEFKEYRHERVNIPAYNAEELRTASVGAGVLLGGLGGAALGTAGGIAASGAAYSAVLALGTASTGTAIASLSGAAATNAALAALGGGALAAGGGGMALGTTILSATTWGAGILIGGVIFNIAGSSLSKKADKARQQMLGAEREINKICSYLIDLRDTEKKFENSLSSVNQVYQKHLKSLERLVIVHGKTDWNEYTPQEEKLVENTVLLVGLLFKMCQVRLVEKAAQETELNTVNHRDVDMATHDARNVLDDLDGNIPPVFA